MTLSRVLNKERIDHYFKTLKYSLYTTTHPFDGFWDLTHEKRGSMAAATTILIGKVVVDVLAVTSTNFQFNDINMERFNILRYILSTLLPILLWCVANWSLTTLLDGKGKLRDIYMATTYAFAPYVIVNAAMIVFSHVITVDEAVLYSYMLTAAYYWSIFLVLAGMMMIHDYTFGKAVLSSIFTVVGIGVIVFIFVMFFSLVSDGVAYFVSIYKEIEFRLH